MAVPTLMSRCESNTSRPDSYGGANDDTSLTSVQSGKTHTYGGANFDELFPQATHVKY